MTGIRNNEKRWRVRMSNDKTRAEFESYISLLDLPTKRDGDKYTDKLVSSYWLLWSYAWQKSRAALVVELPDFFVCGIDAALYRDDVIDALDAAGVAYK